MGKALVVKANLKNGQDIQEMIDNSLAEFGKIDILVNNAGMFDGMRPFCETDEQLWDDTFDLNVRGMFLCCKAVIPSMLNVGKGVIVNIASAAGLIGGGGGVAYTCSKHAVIGLTMQIANELGRQGIRANTICPGLIETGMVTDLMNDPAFMASINGTPSGRIGNVEDISKAILFLASDESSYIYGDRLVVDGGLIVGK